MFVLVYVSVCMFVLVCVCVYTAPMHPGGYSALSVIPISVLPPEDGRAGPGPGSSVGSGYVSQNPALRASLMNWLHNEAQFPFYPANPQDCSFTTMHCSQRTPFPRYCVQPGTVPWHGVFLCLSVCMCACVYEYEFNCMFGMTD